MTVGGVAFVLLGSVALLSTDSETQVIRSGPRSCGDVALTFDLCPVREGSGYDAPLIDMLTEHRIPATFFMSGRWIERHEAEVKALLSVPFFEIGTHGQVHARLPTLDKGHQRAEIHEPVLALKRRFGVQGSLFRPPYGEYDETTVDLARALGLRFILWSVVSGDPDPQISADQMGKVLRETVRGGSIVVFHANGKGRHTRAVVEELSRELLTRGLQPATVSELLGRCGASHD
jgi:peptidoglycan/xylan/chitin deacetylase (PgdA/CDA1 family)